MYVGGEKGEANFLLQIHFPLAQPLRKNIHAILAMQVNTTRELAFPPSPFLFVGQASQHSVEFRKRKNCDLGTEFELHSETQLFETWKHKSRYLESKTSRAIF